MVNEQMGGLLSGLRSSTNSSLAAFAAMEEKVMALEAEAEGATMVRYTPRAYNFMEYAPNSIMHLTP